MSGPAGSSQWMYRTGYEITNSLRFNDNDTAYLSRTPDNAGSRTTFTFSAWVKLSNTTDRGLFGVVDGNSAIKTKGSKIQFEQYGGGTNFFIKTAAVLRDFSAWYHIVGVWDTTNSTAANRIRLYINGERATDLTSNNQPTANYEHLINSATEHRVGHDLSGSRFMDGCMGEVNFIDGQALTASSFGETGDYGEWKPKAYAGAYGDEGFYLDFKSSGVGTAGAATIGADRSGNTNHFTSANVAVTDQVIDSPTNNFPTFNPLQTHSQTLSEGNLKTVTGVTNASNSSIGATSGKWYAEVLFIAGTHCRIGISVGQAGLGENHGFGAGNTWVKINGGYTYHDSSRITQGDTISADHIIGIAVDLDAGKLWFSKNGTWDSNAAGNVGDPAAGTNTLYTDAGISSGKPMFFGVASGSSDLTYGLNCGQDSSFAGEVTAQGKADANGRGDFYYAPPSDFLALCTNNLPEPAIIPSEYFNALVYAGNATDDHAITGVGFQPDFVWGKTRTGTYDHFLVDAARGNTKYIRSNTDADEDTYTDVLKSFDSDGFTLGGAGKMNESNHSHIAWNWKANGAGASNTNGSINTTKTSASVVAGFSIVSYTGNETSGATVGHGLSKAPEMIMVKNRTLDEEPWRIYHASNTAAPATDYLILNSNVATADNAAMWNDTAPSSTLFTLGNDASVNGDEATIAYCFHSVEGYSKVGSYLGNNADDGTFVYTGFRPKWIMVKSASTGGNHYDWAIYDTARSSHNAVGNVLEANQNQAEVTGTGRGLPIDIVSNGFKHRSSYAENNSDKTYIYLAFAETPFKYSNAR